ncbi:MAG: glycosyltransferase family 4 protein, partial [bacterium]|nr:glycosyltransferase family 4 protein [bacterium]
MKHIGIDVRLYSESGNGRYIRNLLLNLYEIDLDNSYVLFCLKKDYENINTLYGKKFKIVKCTFGWYGFGEQIEMPIRLYFENLDLVHFPHFNVPVLYLKTFVVTIHDLTHYSFAMSRATSHNDFVYSIKHFVYNFVFNYAVTQSKNIITVSEYVKSEIVNRFGMLQSKIRVTYEAGGVFGGDSSGSEIRSDIKSIYGNYFFYVGNAHPHKNVEFLINTFELFRKTHPECLLVLAGKKTYFWDRIVENFSNRNLMTNIVYLGQISEAELAYLYKNAVAFIMPSLSEGFGLPVIEAMSNSCPVLSSNATSLPEVGGDACLYFDPKDSVMLLSQMNEIYINSENRDRCIKAGMVQVKKFSWKKMAVET